MVIVSDDLGMGQLKKEFVKRYFVEEIVADDIEAALKENDIVAHPRCLDFICQFDGDRLIITMKDGYHYVITIGISGIRNAPPFELIKHRNKLSKFIAPVGAISRISYSDVSYCICMDGENGGFLVFDIDLKKVYTCQTIADIAHWLKNKTHL